MRVSDTDQADPAVGPLEHAPAAAELPGAPLLIALRDRNLPSPAGAIGISPLLDLTLSSASIDANEGKDPQITRPFLAFAARHYLAEASPRTPLASPLFADMARLPPVILQTGGDELLLDDSLRLAEAAEAAGVDITVERWDGLMHVWHQLAPRLPEAEAALASLARWVRDLPTLAKRSQAPEPTPG